MRNRVEDNREAGEIVIALLQSRVWADHAPTMHANVIELLEANEFAVYPEFRQPYWRARKGRIDIVAEHPDTQGWVGLELDCRTPKRNSIAKLQLFDGYRIIGLRGIEGHQVEGIDACVPMRVQVATAAQKADRRIYRPAPDWASDWKGVA